MSFVLLGVVVSLFAYAAAIVLGTALTAPLLLRAARLPEPAARARRLVALRLLPTAAAIFLVGGLVVPAFFWLEPRDTVEEVSATLAALAGAGLLMLLAGPARGLASFLSTRRLVRRWNRGGLAIELPGSGLPVFSVNEPFPIVSLVGWFHPRLVVTRTVLENCDREELAAILAHEAGHRSRRDPWVRLLLRACPDLLSMTPWAARMERAWSDAAEQDADECAARTGPTRAIDLASALIKVARLAGAGRPPSIPISALYRGEGVAARVTRLLERDPAEACFDPRPRRLLTAALLLALLAFVPAAAALGLHHGVHGALEAVVSFFQ
ncbi:MAG TPA: M56 family metallopeptidase [Vicinamibacteria bacterium]